MTLEVKGRIRFNPDVKPGEPEYILESKQLGIIKEGSGQVEQMMDELTELVKRATAEEFYCAPSGVQIVGYSMGITFAVDGPTNRTLSEFDQTVDSKLDENEMTIQFPGKPPIKCNLEQLELAKKTLEVSKQTGIPPEDLIAMAKKKTGVKGKGAAE